MNQRLKLSLSIVVSITVVLILLVGVLVGVRQTHAAPAAAHLPAPYQVQRGSGNLPSGSAVAAGRATLAQLPQGKLPAIAHQGPVPTYAQSPSGSWRSVGPAPFYNPGFGQNWSGRVSALAVDPTTSGANTTIYLGSASGGVWKSTNNGASWVNQTDNQPNLSTGAIAIDPANHNIVYVGTGEPNQSGDSFPGVGVLRTLDGGAHWALVGGSTFSGTVTSLFINPFNAVQVFAASQQGLYVSSNEGDTWTQITNGLPAYNTVDSLVVDTQTNPLTMLVAERRQGLYRSADGGISFHLISHNLPASVNWNRADLAIAPSNPNVAYLMITTGPGDVYIPSTYNGGYFTQDAGVDWYPMQSLNINFTTTQGWYDMYIAVDPKNDEILYGGGTGMALTTNARGSTGNWQQIADYYGNGPGAWLHPDQHAIAFPACSAAPCPVYLGNDGGIWYSNTTTKPFSQITYTDLNTAPLSTIQFYGGDLGPNYTDQHLMLAGSQDNGTGKFVGSPVWLQEEGGDGAYSQIDPSNPNNMYSEYTYVSLQKSTDGGNSWGDASGGGTLHGASNFYMPYVLDHTNPQHLIAGTNAVYETLNGTTSWYQSSQTFPFSVSNVSVAPANSHVIYVMADQMYRTTNGEAGVQQTYTTLANLPNGRIATTVVVDPNDATGNTAYALLDHIFKTTNGGASWTDISQFLGSNFYGFQSGVIYYSGANRVLVVSGYSGTIFTADDGHSWHQLNLGLPNVVVDQLAIDQAHTTISAFTHGRGAWYITIPETAGGTGDTVGVYQPGSPSTFALRNSLTAGSADETTQFGAATDIPLMGDWNGDGAATVGTYTPSTATFALKNSNAPGAPTLYSFAFGSPNEIPIVGDWTGNGHDGIGVWNPTTGVFSLRETLSAGAADYTMTFGGRGYIPVAGDWNGDGHDSPGLYHLADSTFYLTDQLCNCGVSTYYKFAFGSPNQQPVTGDWTHAGHDGIGLYNTATNTFALRISGTTGGSADFTFAFGSGAVKPLAGHWR